jgi:hypothetical protein
MTYQTIYNALHDQDTDNQHNYHPVYLHNYAACATCGSPTNEACVLCNKPFDHHCLFNVRLPEMHEDNPRMVQSEWGPERAEPDYEFTRICLACFIEHEKHPPFSWGWTSQRFLAYIAPRGAAAIRKGSMIPAGDLDAWVSDPGAAKLLEFHYREGDDKVIWPHNLDAFESLSLLAWMLSWQSEIKTIADQASAALVTYHNKSLERAREADRGYIDYSQFE